MIMQIARKTIARLCYSLTSQAGSRAAHAHRRLTAHAQRVPRRAVHFADARRRALSFSAFLSGARDFNFHKHASARRCYADPSDTGPKALQPPGKRRDDEQTEREQLQLQRALLTRLHLNWTRGIG